MIDLEVEISDRLRGIAKRWRARRFSGSALVEFAFIAPVFFLLLFAIMEIGIMFFAQATMQHATDNLARTLRTGQVQGQGLTQQQVRQIVCNDLAPLIPCDNTYLKIDIQNFSQFGGMGYSPPLDPNKNFNPLNNYQTGTACSVELVRIFYGWPVFTPILQPILSTMANNKHMLYAAAAFRNEPYTQGLSGC